MNDDSVRGDGAVPPVFDLTQFTPYKLALAAQLLSEALARQYRQRFGISIPDWRVLVHLSHSGGASVRDIETSVVMEKSKVSRAASRLEGRGLVAKRPHPEDKRLVHLSLTPEGQALVAEIQPLALTLQAQIEADLGAGFADFAKALDLLADKYNLQGG